MKKLILLFVLLASGLQAQIVHVRWSSESKKISECEYDLIFTANIDKHYHIFSIVKSGDTNPTSFTFTPSSDYVLVGKMKEPAPHVVDDEMMGKMLEHHRPITTFTQRIKLLTDKKTAIKGKFDYQECDTVSCIFPPREDFKFELQGSASCASTESAFGITTSTNACICDTAAILGAFNAKNAVPASADSNINSTEATISQTPKEDSGDCNPWSTLLIGLGFGLGAVLMPCIYSLIPLTVSFFLKQSKTKASGIRNSLLYGFLSFSFSLPSRWGSQSSLDQQP